LTDPLIVKLIKFDRFESIFLMSKRKSTRFKPSNWLQVVYGIPVFAVVPITSALKPETAPYSTIIALAIIGLLFFIVHRNQLLTNPTTQVNGIDPNMIVGNMKGLEVFLDEIIRTKNLSSSTEECKCYEQMIERVTTNITIYREILSKN
jgi:hypothetical protein